jgi:response regulator RpfG family c-di-GMP phosphodiesterase
MRMADGVSNGVRRPRALLAASNFTPRVTAILLIILFIFLGWTFFWLLYAERQSMLSARRQALSDQLTSALSVCLYFENQVQTGVQSIDDSKREALAILNNMRYGEMNSGYFFVVNKAGILLAHPLRPDLVNTSLSRVDDHGGQTFIVNLLRTVRLKGQGFLTYSWQGRGVTQGQGPRLACFAQLKTWDWIIVTDASTADIDERISNELSQQVFLLILLSAILALVLSSTLRRLVLAGVDRLILLAQRLQEGDFSARAFSTGADELSPLSTAFNQMAEGIQRRDELVRQAQRASVFALAKLAEARDNETGGHLLRVREYSVLLAGALRDHPRFAGIIDDAFLEDLYDAVMLHDIGKVAIPDHILLKPDVLDEGEMAIMMSHTLIGANTIRTARRQMKVEEGFLVMAEQIARSHHERWDGTGYVEQLQGEQIPAPARIFSLADVYDALTTPRAYKPAFSHVHAVQLISEERGRRFDPDALDAFMSLGKEFDGIRRAYADDVNHR